MANPSASPPPSCAQTTRECTGGDISRKKKLLEEQKKGNVGGSENSVGRCFPDYTDAWGRQATSGQYGNVSIPQEAFIAALRMGEE